MMYHALQCFPERSATFPKRQVAALCYRGRGSAQEVLLITSRRSGRWVTPKGWPMKGKQDHEAALQEAWEEAGVAAAKITQTPIGWFSYNKRVKGGVRVFVSASVYLAEVTQLADRFPERKQRKRAWMSPAQAAHRVAEPQLQNILTSFEKISELEAPTHDCFLSM